jgi:hypothetical protein
MKVEIFWDFKLDRLQSDINRFIHGKNVTDIKYQIIREPTETTDMEVTTWVYAFVHYEDVEE